MSKTLTQLPCDMEAERTVLASILVDADPSRPVFNKVLASGITAKSFFEPKHQTIFNACVSVSETNRIPDELTVCDCLRTDGFLELAGGVFYVNDLTGKLFAPSANISSACQIIQDKHHARTIIRIANDTIDKALSGAHTPLELADGFTTQVKQSMDASRPMETTQVMKLDDLMAFDRHNDPSTLIGRRWLCKGGSLLFSGQAGTGKSSLLTTMAIHWALGKDLWGMKPVRPMRIVILQSENDLGDLSEQWCDVCTGLELTKQDHDALAQRVFIYREAVKTGDAFGHLIEELVTRHSADFLAVDPLLGFSGGDISKQEFCSHFLRQVLQPVLMRTGCCLIAAHHQNKPPRKKDDQQAVSSTYDFTGSSELANWFRATAILRREDNELPHFVLKLGKRGNRAGMKDHMGSFTESLRIRHSKIRGEIRWERNNAPLPNDDQI